MRAAVAHRARAARRRTASTPTRPAGAGRWSGSPPRRSCRWTCCAPPAPRTSGGRRCPYVPGCAGRRASSSARRAARRGHAGVVRHPRPAWRRATAAWPSAALVPDADLVPLPPTVPDDVAGRARALRRRRLDGAHLAARGCRPGERVLVLGAGGAVGQAAVGAAQLLGAGRVVARLPVERRRRSGPGGPAPTRSSALDADVDALTGALPGRVRRQRRRRRRPRLRRRRRPPPARVLAPGGRLVNLGGASGDVAEFSSAVLRSRTLQILGYTNNALTPSSARAALTARRRPRRGRPARRSPHEVLPLADVADAWRRQASGQAGVRLVLTP